MCRSLQEYNPVDTHEEIGVPLLQGPVWRPGKQAASAIKKYRGHRVIPHTIFDELTHANPLSRYEPAITLHSFSSRYAL